MAEPDMRDVPGEVMHLEIHRTAGALERNPSRTFSAEVLDGLGQQVSQWAASRILRRWDETGEAPSLLVVDVKVSAR